jgi:hypothetical protein
MSAPSDGEAIDFEIVRDLVVGAPYDMPCVSMIVNGKPYVISLDGARKVRTLLDDAIRVAEQRASAVMATASQVTQ